ncbi:MAG: phosphate:Na+ symporter, partial [Flavobacteriales bacterium]
MNKHALTLFSFLLYAVIGFAQPADSLSIQDFLEDQIQEALNVVEPVELDGEIFQNFTSKGTEGGAKLTWNINYDVLPLLKGKELVIRYNTSVGAKRSKENYEDSEWKLSDPLPLTTTSFTLKGLAEHEKYEAFIGLAKSGKVINVASDKEQMIWSSKTKFKTERSWGIAKLLILIGSLGLFIFGMKIMSDGLQR